MNDSYNSRDENAPILAEFVKMNEWAMRNISDIWETLKIYLQIVGIMLLLEGYILSEYLFPKLNSMMSHEQFINYIFIILYPPIIIWLFSWHTRRMIQRSYIRFLENIASIVSIRKKLSLIDYNIYPPRWISTWNRLPDSLQKEYENFVENFVNENTNRKDTAYAQMIFMTKLIDISMLLLIIAMIIILFNNIY